MPPDAMLPSTDTMLEATALSCSTARGRVSQPLFADLTFAAGQGEILQVTGKNGAGKTTLLKVLLGLHQDYEGEVVWSLDDYPLYIGHARGLKDRLTVLENLRWMCELHAQPCGSSDLKAALEKAGLGHQAGELCGNLSQGEQKRVCLARLFAQRAQCWVLDEPMSSIDAEGVSLMNHTLSDHAQSGGLVILTSHQPLAISSRQLDL